VLARGAPAEDPGLTHWSSRDLARRIGISHNEIASIWREWGMQPHRTESPGGPGSIADLNAAIRNVQAAVIARPFRPSRPANVPV